uniref:Uncharacterized protein n=1 Tax=Ciona savignyi TaxID=51511 RepID=H2YIU0_CIOSA
KEGTGQYAPYSRPRNDQGLNKPPQNYYSAAPNPGFHTSSPPGAPNTSPAS